MNAPVTYLADLCETVGDPDKMFEIFDTELGWARRNSTPRDEFYANDTPAAYTYGTGEHARTYEPSPWHPLMLDIRAVLEAHLDTNLDVCFMNRYAGPRDHLGWHADDSPEMDPARPIVTVSLGAVRDIQFRPNGGDPDTIETLTLGHGSAAVMAPLMQKTWRHRIPKSGRQIGTRISLTYRGYLVV